MEAGTSDWGAKAVDLTHDKAPLHQAGNTLRSSTDQTKVNGLDLLAIADRHSNSLI